MNRQSISLALFPGFAADLYSRGQLYKIHSAEEGFITVDLQEVDYLISAEDAAKVSVDITKTLRAQQAAITQALLVLQAAIIDAAQLGKRAVTFDLTGLGSLAVDKLIVEVKAKGYSCCRNKYYSYYLDIGW